MKIVRKLDKITPSCLTRQATDASRYLPVHTGRRYVPLFFSRSRREKEQKILHVLVFRPFSHHRIGARAARPPAGSNGEGWEIRSPPTGTGRKKSSRRACLLLLLVKDVWEVVHFGHTEWKNTIPFKRVCLVLLPYDTIRYDGQISHATSGKEKVFFIFFFWKICWRKKTEKCKEKTESLHERRKLAD